MLLRKPAELQTNEIIERRILVSKNQSPRYGVNQTPGLKSRNSRKRVSQFDLQRSAQNQPRKTGNVCLSAIALEKLMPNKLI
jgi:hypothetical protein